MKRSEGINFKEKFGDIPKSCMKFKKSKELMELIEYDDSEAGVNVNEGGMASSRGGGYAKNMRYSIYNPDQAKFIIEYYTNENDVIFDPFMGRATRPLISTLLKRKYIGCDVNYTTYEKNIELLNKKFPEYKGTVLVKDCGVSFSKELENKDCHIDAVFTCPPYYDIEKYEGAKGDLSHMSFDEYDKKMQELFHNLHRLIRCSDYQNAEFYPVIFTVGTLRKGNKGLIDMDYKFQQFAYNAGFVLHDKLITENISPGAGFTFRRNFDYHFTCKNHETTLVFLKYE